MFTDERDIFADSAMPGEMPRTGGRARPAECAEPGGSADNQERPAGNFSTELARIMDEHHVGVRELARRTNYDPAHISHIRNGKRLASLKAVELIDNALDAGGRLAALAHSEYEKRGRARAAWPGNRRGEEEEMERRRLLQSLAALGVAVSPAVHAIESIRGSVGVVFAHQDREHLDNWEEAVMEYGYSYLTTSPGQLIPDLAADLVAIRSVVSRISSQDAKYRDWCRIGGILSGLMAKSLSNLGDTRESRQWWNMAQHVIDSSGDLNLGLWVRGQRIIHGLYENRPVQVLVRQAATAGEFAREHACAGLADVYTGRAQVSVLSGDCRSAEEELRRAEDILGLLPPAVTQDTSSVMGWGEARLRYTETWVYSHMGDENKTDRTVERALQLYPRADARSPAQVKLMQAFARIRRGDISEGIRHAQAAYESLSAEQRTTMVDTLARRVLESVPDGARNRPDVLGYRAIVTPSAQRMIES